MKSIKSKLAVVMAAFFVAGGASAATIFEDDFNRNNSTRVGNGWSEIERNSNDVGIVNNQLMLRDSVNGLPDAAASSLVIDATGYENVVVEFTWRSLSSRNESSDRLYLSWAESPAPSIRDENAWTRVFSGGDSYPRTHSESISLADASDTLFNIMLWTNVTDNRNGDYEGFMIDSVRVTGDAISPVPLPAGFPLLLGGLAFFGVARRMRKAA